MRVKVAKTLNPQAEEWRPHHLIPPPLAAPPPPPPPLQVVPLLPQLPQHHHYYYSNPRPSYHGFLPLYTQRQPQPFYYYSFPTTTEFLYKGKENDVKKEEDEVKSLGAKCPKSPRVDVFEKGVRRGFRFPSRGAVRYFHVEKKPSIKQTWKPRSANPGFKASGGGDGGATPSPPPCDADHLSHSSNTTVMIKNIPNQLRRDFMLKFLDGYSKLYSLEYDFFYLPMDFRKKDNLGYAFVNFTTAIDAVKFKKILHNYRWEVVYTDAGAIKSKKVCEITWARIQGKEALIRRFQKSCFICDVLDFLPVILDPPRNGSDPNPPPPVILGTLCRAGSSKIR